MFGVAKSPPPWDLRSLYQRLTSPPPRMSWPEQEPANAPMQRDTTYVCNYSQILNYIVTPDAVYASVRAGFKSALLAWTVDGAPLWDQMLFNSEGKTRFNFFDYGRQLAVAGPHLILSYEDGRAGGENALLWVDRQTGKTTNKVSLDGRLHALAYYPKVQMLLTIVNVPDATLIEGRKLGRMEVVAYSTDGREAWRRRLPTHDTQPLRFDGEVIVVSNIPPYYPHERPPNQGALYVKRLDPANGNDLWSASPEIDSKLLPTATIAGSSETGRSEGDEAVSIYFRGHIMLYNVANGQTLWQWKIPSTLTGMPKLLEGDSRHLYVTRGSSQPGSPGAIAYPSGEPVWSDSSVEAYHTQPVVWGDKAVYLVWPSKAPTTGMLPFARLYIRTPQSTFLCTEQEIDLKNNIPPQVHGELLYVINGYNIVAYRWLGDT